MTKVFFATNRLPSANPLDFSNTVAPYDPKRITFARAEVSGIDLNIEGSGRIVSIDDVTTENFDATLTAQMVGAANNLLIFIHGFDNSFQDAIKRAAFNREWFAASGITAADTTVVAFSWPSSGMLIAAPPHMPPDAYRSDLVQAGRSAFHIAYFLRVVDQLQASYRAKNPNGRVFLLAHSMGNHALSGAVQLWSTSNDSNTLLFDEVVLAAADEAAGCLNVPALGQMTGLRQLARRISVYFSRVDTAMYISTTINLTQRLGFDGPLDRTNQAIFPANEFRMVDCTEIRDYNLLDPPDASHQYYRRSKLVRGDIAATFDGR